VFFVNCYGGSDNNDPSTLDRPGHIVDRILGIDAEVVAQVNRNGLDVDSVDGHGLDSYLWETNPTVSCESNDFDRMAQVSPQPPIGSGRRASELAKSDR
jgi:hypothetical protein